MWKACAMKRKIFGAMISAALVATAFNPAGCTVTVDQNTMNQVVDWLNTLDTSGSGMMNAGPCSESRQIAPWDSPCLGGSNGS
jgi:hypothetical protein